MCATRARASAPPTSSTCPSAARSSIRLTSDNVIHSFWVPQIGGKVDVIPGQPNYFRFTIEQHGALPRPVRRVLRPPARQHGRVRARRPARPVRAMGGGHTRNRRASPRRSSRRRVRWCSSGWRARAATRSAAPRPSAPSGPDLTDVASRAHARRGRAREQRAEPPAVDPRSPAIQAGRADAAGPDSRTTTCTKIVAYLDEPAGDPMTTTLPALPPRRRRRPASATKSSRRSGATTRGCSGSSPRSITSGSASGTSTRRFVFFFGSGLLALVMRAPARRTRHGHPAARGLQRVLHRCTARR